MALEIQNQRIVGTINDIHSMNGIGLHDNLQEKLNGELPINRFELLHLVNSWGRDKEFSTNDNIIITECKATQCYDLSKLDTSEITDMSHIFTNSKFNDIHSTNGIGLHNGDISNWDVSNVTDMRGMFAFAEKFNRPLNKWDVSNVTNMDGMFTCTRKFDQALNNWNVSNVTNMHGMFEYALKFNQILNSWNVSNVTNMSEMFFGTPFNQALDNWNVSNVTSMSRMFEDA